MRFRDKARESGGEVNPLVNRILNACVIGYTGQQARYVELAAQTQNARLDQSACQFFKIAQTLAPDTPCPVCDHFTIRHVSFSSVALMST